MAFVLASAQALHSARRPFGPLRLSLPNSSTGLASPHFVHVLVSTAQAVRVRRSRATEAAVYASLRISSATWTASAALRT